MNLGFRKIKKEFILFSCLIVGFCLNMAAFAQENIISSVVITKSKSKPNTYELNIDSSQVADYKTKIVNDNNLIFELKNSTLAQNASTYYEEAGEIDSVSVKQASGNKVQIFVQGNNAKNTELLFINSLFEETTPSKKLNINKPINQYLPTTGTLDLENQNDIQDWDDNSFNFSHFLSATLSAIKEGGLGIFMIFALIFAIIVMVIKSVASKYSQDSEPLIGLKQSSLYTNPYDTIYGKNNNNELEEISTKNEALKNVQTELNKAHQKYQSYLQNKYKDNYQNKTKNINVDAIKRGIALNQYQRSSQNPYQNQEVVKFNQINSQFYNKNSTREQNEVLNSIKSQKTKDFTSPYIQRSSSKINKATNFKTNPDNASSMKFLESVTKIYEQSGRADLANGLKNSISKAKQSI